MIIYIYRRFETFHYLLLEACCCPEYVQCLWSSQAALGYVEGDSWLIGRPFENNLFSLSLEKFFDINFLRGIFWAYNSGVGNNVHNSDLLMHRIRTDQSQS